MLSQMHPQEETFISSSIFGRHFYYISQGKSLLPVHSPKFKFIFSLLNGTLSVIQVHLVGLG